MMYLIIGFIIGIILTIIFFIPRVKQKNQLDQHIQQQNEQLKIAKQTLSDEKDSLDEKVQSLLDYVNESQKKIDNQLEDYYNNSKARIDSKLESDTNQAKSDYEKAILDYQNEYKIVMSDAAENLSETLSNYQIQIDEENIQIENTNLLLVNKNNEYKNFCEILKRAQEEKDKQSFYRLQISQEDRNEIDIIREIIPKMRDASAINKIIYKTYFEKAYTDLVGRVIGKNTVIGIYKITNLTNGMSYVGQSRNIAERFRQHIKAGLGIDSSNNKLYSAMKKDGVENFSFEIIEKCNPEDLNREEKLWIDNLQTNSWGYNETKGGS